MPTASNGFTRRAVSHTQPACPPPSPAVPRRPRYPQPSPAVPSRPQPPPAIPSSPEQPAAH
eukprot:6359532-Prymnesium_polylepis.1